MAKPNHPMVLLHCRSHRRDSSLSVCGSSQDAAKTTLVECIVEATTMRRRSPARYSSDLVPSLFHQDQATAWRRIRRASKALKRGGEERQVAEGSWLASLLQLRKTVRCRRHRERTYCTTQCQCTSRSVFHWRTLPYFPQGDLSLKEPVTNILA